MSDVYPETIYVTNDRVAEADESYDYFEVGRTLKDVVDLSEEGSDIAIYKLVRVAKGKTKAYLSIE